jgi:hypothetical protein
MSISRRQFAGGIAGAAALGCTAARLPDFVLPSIIERRVYALGSVLPPLTVLQRNGIYPQSVKRQQDGTAYLIAFASEKSRVKAWDQFNADEDWRVIRDTGRVALREIRVHAVS